MTPPLTPTRPLEGPGSAARTQRLQRRFAQVRRSRGPHPLALIGKRLLVAYWIACLAVIALGLDRLYPDVRPASVAALAAMAPATVADFQPDLPLEPAARLTHPFRTCAAAHAAGVYDIPAGSPAYTPRQDGDNDGLACEPY